MERSQLNMFASVSFWLLVFLCVTDPSRAAPRAKDNNASHSSRRPRAVSSAPLEVYNTTTMPNYLPDDKLGILTLSAFTATTTAARTLGEAATPFPTTTRSTFIESSTTTVEPTVRRRDVTDVTANTITTTEAKLSGTTAFYGTTSALPSTSGKPAEYTTPSVTSSTVSLTTTTAAPPVQTTTDSRQGELHRGGCSSCRSST